VRAVADERARGGHLELAVLTDTGRPGTFECPAFLLTRAAYQQSHPVELIKVRLPNFFDLSMCFDAVAVPVLSTLRRVRLPNFFAMRDVLAFWGQKF
jgi:hypothetical protein